MSEQIKDGAVAWLCESRDGYNCDAVTTSHARDTYANAGRKITPLVGVPDENWLADQLCDLRNKWSEGSEANWLETDDNHPDDWMAKELRKRLLAAREVTP